MSADPDLRQDADRRRADEQAILLYGIRRSNGWMAFFSMMVAVAVCSSAFFYYQQLSVMQDQLDEMQELTKQIQKTIALLESADAQRSAQNAPETLLQQLDAASRRAVEVSDSTAKAVLSLDRPWVGLSSVVVDPLLPDQRLLIKATIQNTGKSPALAVRASFEPVVAVARGLVNPKIDACSDCPQPALMPNALLSFEVAVDGALMTREQIVRIRNGQDTVLLFGRIDYLDTAGQPHQTLSCMRWLPNSPVFGACAEGNSLN
jgi:hypothetical protein